MLNIWPWSKIRELEAVLEKTRELLRRTESACQHYEVELGNCAKYVRYLEGERRALEDQVIALGESKHHLETENRRLEKQSETGQDQYYSLKKEFWSIVDERNQLLDILAISPRAWKRKRIELRRMYKDFGAKSAFSLWVKKPASLFKVYSPAELPEPLGACPRCSHSDAELIRTEDGLHYVQCRKCGAMTDDCKHAEDAVRLWNEGRVLDE